MNNSNSESAKMARQGKSIGKRKCPRKRQLFQKKRWAKRVFQHRKFPTRDEKKQTNNRAMRHRKCLLGRTHSKRRKKKENNKEPTDDTKSNRQPEMKRWSAAIFARQNKRESSRQNDEQTNEDAPVTTAFTAAVRVLFCLFFSFFFSKKKFRPRFGAAAA